MNPITMLRNRLGAKLAARDARQTIRDSRSALETGGVNLPLLAFIQSKPWAISSTGIQRLASHAHSSLDLSFADFFELRPETTVLPNGVALIHVHGALVDGAPAVYEKLGLVTKYSTIISDIAAVTANGAKQIVLVFNSPGGTVAGVQEASNAITASTVPITSYCAGMACSAAYHLAAGTRRIVASPSATVGNIGTILSWADDSAFWEAIGIEWKALVNEGADLKSTFHLEPDETQVKFLQDSINAMGKAFRSHVEQGRPGINPEVFRAGWYSGDKAKSLGLVDELGTLESLTGQPAASSSTKNTPAPAAVKTASPVSSQAKPPSKTMSTTPPTTALERFRARQAEASAVVPVPANPFANADTLTLIQGVSGKAPIEKHAGAAAELTNRGFEINGNQVILPRALYDKMSPAEKSSTFKAGARLGPGTNEHGATNTSIAAATELTFPEPSKKTPRTVAQFMALSAAEVQQVNADTGYKTPGAGLRQEVMDAFASFDPRNWRHGEINPAGKITLDDLNFSKLRRAFYDKFNVAWLHVVQYGPIFSTPNDPAPPINPNAMTAQQFSELSQPAIDRLNATMQIQSRGRNIRAELKRAYRNGSSAEKASLLASFENSLRLFPEEPV